MPDWIKRLMMSSKDKTKFWQAFRALGVDQQAVIAAMYCGVSAMDVIWTVAFPDDRCLEVRRHFCFTMVRESGTEKWEQTLLRDIWDVLGWIRDAELRLIATKAKD